MSLDEDHLKNKVPPPPNLSKENYGIWLAWNQKGSKEVAREAATKGLRDLVVDFLKLRNCVTQEDAEKYFKDEVLVWVKELLDRKQIFRVSHILQNIGVDPTDELSQVFYTTKNKELRDYIGNHLKGQNKLNERMQLLWHFLDLIMKNSVLISRFKLIDENIQFLENQSSEWKSEIASKIFLRTYDNLLIPLLNGDSLWKQLLFYNNTKVLSIWINIAYGDNEEQDIPESFQAVLKSFPITDEMIKALDDYPNIRDIILNYLSRFGVFCQKERSDIVNILWRINETGNLENIYEIIRSSTSNVQERTFFRLLVDYCLKYQLLPILSTCVEKFEISKEDEDDYQDLALISNFRKFDINNEQSLQDNILKVAKYFSKDLDAYFKDNPLLLLSVLLFTENLDYWKVFKEKYVIISGNTLTDSISSLLNNYNTLYSVVERNTIVKKSAITYYDLLEKHMGLNVKELFSYHFNKSPMPNFQTPQLVESIGYKKKVNYVFYLMNFRPSFAAKYFLIENYKQNNCISEEIIKQAQKKVYKIAIRNIDNTEICASCVAFLEMVGINSNFLRSAMEAAKIIFEFSENMEYTINLFLNIEVEPYEVLNKLEEVVIARIDFEQITDGLSLIQAIESYEMVLEFARSYNLKFPQMFLKYCAYNNMWLPFLIFAQINRYPIDHVKVAAQSFKNPNLLEHIIHSVVHDIQIEDQNVLIGERDPRKYFLSRIGVRKSIESLNNSESAYSSKTSQSSLSSNISSAESELLEIDISNMKTTLAQTLIRCHNSSDPPKALLQACQHYRYPLLAIFATLYEPDSLIINWLTWLAVSSELYEVFTNFETIATSAQSVATLLNNCMKHQYPRTLEESFQIFLPENPLRHIMKFFNLCIIKEFEVTSLTALLETYKLSLQKCRRCSIISENDREFTFLNNKAWIEQTSVLLLSSTLEYNMYSLYEQIELLTTLINIKMDSYIRCPNLENLLKILETIFESGNYFRFSIVLYFDSKERQAVLDCINVFLERELFEYAIKIAEIEGLPLDFILTKKWHRKYQDKIDDTFWQSVNEQFILYNVTADCVVEFYTGYLEKVESNLEKYQLLKLAHDWARKFSLSSKYELEKQKWLLYVIIDDKSELIDNEIAHPLPFHVTFKDMTEMLRHVIIHTNQHLTDNMTDCLNAALNTALDKENLWVALKLEKMFGCENTDLETMKVLYSLAEGLMMPYQLNTEQRRMLIKTSNFRRYSHRRTLLSSRISSTSSGTLSTTNLTITPSTSDLTEVPFEDTLSILCTLAEKVRFGSELALRIYMTYRISVNIEIPYHVIVSNTDPMKLLKDALEDDCSNKLEVVHDFFNVYKWSKEQISDFICEEVVNSVNTYVSSKTELYLMWDLKMDQDFHLVLKLIQENCSMLGNKIYSYASTIHKAQVVANLDFRISELVLVIELLIKAHDCFTADCNMEGITTILKKCQKVISHLLTLRSWKLIVRLLTGIGRYTEMNYVFQILKDNDQFEYLLRKGSNKDNALKIALLEFLRKHCPDNGDLFKIVALHFALFSEVAMLWEREAQSVIRNLIAISKLEMQNNKLNPDTEDYILLTNTDGTRMCLNKAMENYTHATEFHLQGEKLGKAMHSAKQAELMALQFSLLKGLPTNGTAICLLNLNEAQLISLICGPLCFEQSSILVQSYNHQPDWSAVLFEQCILKNNRPYLESFMQQLPMSDSVVHGICRKFLAANLNSPVEVDSMKAILNKLVSVHTKYRLASELGFVDIVEDLIQGEQLAYLKDTVWKKGYKG